MQRGAWPAPARALLPWQQGTPQGITRSTDRMEEGGGEGKVVVGTDALPVRVLYGGFVRAARCHASCVLRFPQTAQQRPGELALSLGKGGAGAADLRRRPDKQTNTSTLELARRPHLDMDMASKCGDSSRQVLHGSGGHEARPAPRASLHEPEVPPLSPAPRREGPQHVGELALEPGPSKGQAVFILGPWILREVGSGEGSSARAAQQTHARCAGHHHPAWEAMLTACTGIPAALTPMAWLRPCPDPAVGGAPVPSYPLEGGMVGKLRKGNEPMCVGLHAQGEGRQMGGLRKKRTR